MDPVFVLSGKPQRLGRAMQPLVGFGADGREPGGERSSAPLNTAHPATPVTNSTTPKTRVIRTGTERPRRAAAHLRLPAERSGEQRRCIADPMSTNAL